MKALSNVPIRDMRWLGGKIGKLLNDAGLERMGDIQELDAAADLAPLVGLEKAQWIKNLSLGICTEEVNEKSIPKTASAIKTFKPIHSLEKTLKQVSLVCADLVFKIRENLREKDIYPTSLLVYQRAVAFSRDREKLKTNQFKKTVKMVPYEDFIEDPNVLTTYTKQIFKDYEGELAFPVRILGATVQNFKPVKEVKLPTRKINNIFSRVNINSDSKKQYFERLQKEQLKISEMVK